MIYVCDTNGIVDTYESVEIMLRSFKYMCERDILLKDDHYMLIGYLRNEILKNGGDMEILHRVLR